MMLSDNGTNFMAGDREMRELATQLDQGRHRGEGGAGGGGFSPPLFWLIKLLFQFFSKVLHKKVHRVILCQTCGPQRKHCNRRKDFGTFKESDFKISR